MMKTSNLCTDPFRLAMLRPRIGDPGNPGDIKRYYVYVFVHPYRIKEDIVQYSRDSYRESRSKNSTRVVGYDLGGCHQTHSKYIRTSTRIWKSQ
jgi:hypothetical protein